MTIHRRQPIDYDARPWPATPLVEAFRANEAALSELDPAPERRPLWGRLVWAFIFGGTLALGCVFAVGIAVLVMRLIG